jgi:phospholipase C
MPVRRLAASYVVLSLVVAACTGPNGATDGDGSPAGSRTLAPIPAGLEQLDHLIFIVMENRSFDHYFGT